ncbi:PaaI family thioesterase [Kibdelosporangium philippinense]|uniref:PaaI family thioesterase n=1 Tax=Kibdelosporangium philippinense TaxID=211113 RepID=A0ABS8Z6M3_9PSEU|nr:PaaI family thioesterase [Kibdelosporangium philippinense]MCE7002713.1 PaaI family thioesterase [Kibdelosporangium philippinense]
MPTPTGFFWDMMAGRTPAPAAADTLGWKLREVDPDAGTIEVEFAATDKFTNPAGHVQGGFLAAMLDDTMGPALAATLGPGQFAPTLDLHVQFLRMAWPGTLIGRATVVRRGKQVCHLRGELTDSAGRVIATAVATAMVQRGERVRDRSTTSAETLIG